MALSTWYEVIVVGDQPKDPAKQGKQYGKEIDNSAAGTMDSAKSANGSTAGERRARACESPEKGGGE